MTLRDVIDNWEHLSAQKRRQALQAVINWIDYEDEFHDLHIAILNLASEFEEEDYFGTEGLTL